MRYGTTRVVLLIGSFAIKFPRPSNIRRFAMGILANMDERLWFRESPADWKLNMAPALYCFWGFVLIAKRARSITQKQYETINDADYIPLPYDKKIDNFGLYEERIVLVDYGATRFVTN